MIEKIIRKIIVGYCNKFFEDFAESEDLIIDKWNGIITKENAIFKLSALNPIIQKIFSDIPIRIKSALVGKIKISVPWSEIFSKPVEVILDEVHFLCDSPISFDKNWFN